LTRNARDTPLTKAVAQYCKNLPSSFAEEKVFLASGSLDVTMEQWLRDMGKSTEGIN
jgi:hypothetical protein